MRLRKQLLMLPLMTISCLRRSPIVSLPLAASAAILLFLILRVHGQIYVESGSSPNATIAEYDGYSGAPINTSLITGLNLGNIFKFDNILYVTQGNLHTLGEYDATTGAAINASFITGLRGQPDTVIRSGNILYTAGNTGLTGTLGLYDAITGAQIASQPVTEIESLAILGNTLYVGCGAVIGQESIVTFDATTGGLINNHFIANLWEPTSIVAIGNTLYVADSNNKIETYNATTGAAINTSFVTGVSSESALALSSGNQLLYATDYYDNTVREYDPVSGATINSNVIPGLSGPIYIAAGIPEPSSVAFVGLGIIAIFGCGRQLRKTLRGSFVNTQTESTFES